MTALLRNGLGLVLMALTAVSMASAQVKAVDVHQLAENVDKHYNSISSLETKFTETYKGAGVARTESGTMYLKKPGRMRWDYTTPRQKLFVTDGKNAWFYVPGERQARRASVKDLDDLRSPLRYLLGKTKLEKEFEGLSQAVDKKPQGPGNVVLRGIPRSMADRVSEVRLEITPENRIAGIYIEELDGSTTEFWFQDQRENVPIADQKFKFAPPAGVEVMEAKELEP